MSDPAASTTREGGNAPAGVDAKLARHGGLSYLEIPAIDVQQSSRFYQAVVGWKPRGEADDPSRFADPSGHLIGRWVQDRAIARKPGLLPFIYVDQIEEAVKQVEPLGGAVVKAIHPEGDLLIAIIRDPAGNLIGVWQEAHR